MTLPGGASLTTRRYHDCQVVVVILGLYWLTTCPSTHAAFMRRHVEVNHAIRTPLLGANNTSTIERSLLDLNPQEGNPGLKADPLVNWIEGQSSTFVDVAVIWPTSPTFLAGTQLRRGKASPMMFQQKCHKYATAVRTQPGVVGIQHHFVPLAWETSGFSHPKSAC